MHIAALYDVHGNLPALEAVLAEVDRIRADLILIGGDVALGPFPRETLERLVARGEQVSFIRGNADRALVEGGSLPASAGELGEKRRRWAAERLTAEQRDFLSRLPETRALEVAGLGSTLFCHGTPRSDDEIITRITPEERLLEIFGAVKQRVVVCGHTHMQFDRRAGKTRIVNAGSVGMPYEGRPGAYWVLLGPEVAHQRTMYDLEKAAAEIRASGFPGAEEFARKNVLEPPTADEATELFEGMARKSANR